MEILWARNGTVPPPWATMKRISGQRLSVPVKIRLTMARVVSKTYSTTKGGAPRFGVLGRFAVGRMDKNHRLAPVELVENRIEQRIAQIAVH